MTFEPVSVLAGLAAGAALALFAWAHGKKAAEKAETARNERDEARLENAALKAQLAGAEKRDAERKADFEKRLAESKQQFDELQNAAKAQFKAAADEILERKTAKFTETNRTNIDRILEPLKTQLEEFKKAVEKNGQDSATQYGGIKESIELLVKTASSVGSKADSLAEAIKGDSKTQGDWGETLLETILQSTGLRKGVHYRTQENVKDEIGSNFRPDVVVDLPDRRCVVVDSKVSLAAYKDYCDARDDAGRDAALKAHLASVQKHVDELADKNYEGMVSGALDFKMMFVPVEPAFLVAVQAKPSLWTDAYRKKVVIVSPTNLIACLRIVEDLWKREDRNRNALEIARRGGLLLDKFHGFLENFAEIGARLGKAEEAYGKAYKQLAEGNANLVSQAESLEKLGVKASKALPAAFREAVDDDAPAAIPADPSGPSSS
ncbi:MAG: DNA recombination protein RmuC [Fibrobacterales bacterium]|nr:DNA recombination protein RmuC [Fibrobacterales bacterium]